MSEKFCTAISAAATGSTSPASARRQSGGPAGENRRPAASHHRGVGGLRRACAGGWTDLGEFPIAGFSKAERVYGLLDETPVPA
jgi:hypothetical protein